MSWSLLKCRLRVNITAWLSAHEVFSDALLWLGCVITHLMGHAPAEIAPEGVDTQVCLWIECLLGLVLFRVLTDSSSTVTQSIRGRHVLAESVAA